MAKRKKGKNDFGEDLVLCPECKSERVHTAAVSRYYVNTGDHFCHSVKTYDSCSPAGCCDCDWEGVRADLYPGNGQTITQLDAELALKLLNDLDQEEEAFTRWTYSEGYPPDGDYWCRADVEDEDVMRIGIRDGEARDHTGMRKIIYGYEWKLRPPLPPRAMPKGDGEPTG